MFVQTLAVAAAAAALAPFALAQTADAPEAVPATGPFAACAEKLGAGGSHSVLDIFEGSFTEINLLGEESVLAPLLEEVTAETTAILTEFDATGVDSYTMLVPLNTDRMGNMLNETFDLSSAEALAAADDIIQAHILPGTIDFATLEEETNSTGMYTVTSLQGFEWTFGWNMGDEGGFPFIVDMWNATEEGVIEIMPDIRNEPDCPNRIIGITGFVVTPDELTEAPAPALVNAPAPRSLDPPVETPPATPTEPATTTETTTDDEDASNGAGSCSTSGLAALSVVGAAALAAALL